MRLREGRYSEVPSESGVEPRSPGPGSFLRRKVVGEFQGDRSDGRSPFGGHVNSFFSSIGAKPLTLDL